MRIIDRDIHFYQGQKNRHISLMGMRSPSERPIHRQFIEKAELAIRALKEYRDLIDKYNTDSPET